ncbi:MAG: patatin-like phospholipase family protein [Verrucomicrobia bacterium]|nr:patatin-like phospholipase family protein [Verrucomicrobiota bacterium]
MKKILTIDSGGIRGIIPAIVLAEIEARLEQPICHLFDLIAGTSAGGMLALALNRPKVSGSSRPLLSASEIAEFFYEWGHHIFRTRDPIPDQRRAANKCTERIEEIFHQYFGDTRLSESITPTLVTALDISAGQPVFLKSMQTGRNGAVDIFMWQAARATTAIPSHFDPISLTISGSPFSYSRQATLIDGSLFACNPAMCAFAEAQTLFPEEDDFLLISLGCGEVSREANAPNTKMKRYLLDSSLAAQSNCVDHQLQKFLPSQRYLRIQPELAPGMNRIDSACNQQLLEMEQAARQALTENATTLKRIADLLAPGLKLAAA